MNKPIPKDKVLNEPAAEQGTLGGSHPSMSVADARQLAEDWSTKPEKASERESRVSQEFVVAYLQQLAQQLMRNDKTARTVCEDAARIIDRQADQLTSLQRAVCPLKEQLHQARQVARWPLEKEKLEREIEDQAEQLAAKNKEIEAALECLPDAVGYAIQHLDRALKGD